MSVFSRPPSSVKNLKPLRLKGRWEAVMMIAPLYWNPAGVAQGKSLTTVQIRTARGSHCLLLCASGCMAALLCPAWGSGLHVCEHLQCPSGSNIRNCLGRSTSCCCCKLLLQSSDTW